MLVIVAACMVFLWEWMSMALKSNVIWIMNCCTTFFKLQSDINLELLKLRREQGSISIQNEFAKHARLQRKINLLTDRLNGIKKSQASDILKYYWISKLIMNSIFTILSAVLLYKYCYDPVIILPKNWFPYLHCFIAYPCNVEGAVSLPFWLMVCRQVSKVVLY